MDQGSLVTAQQDDGEALLRLLASNGFEIKVAFWAVPLDEERWYLYVATPVVDAGGPIAAYRSYHRIVSKEKWRWLDPFDVRLIGTSDPAAVAAVGIMTPTVPDHPFAVQQPAPCPPTWTRRPALGELRLGGPAFIYPLQQSVPAA